MTIVGFSLHQVCDGNSRKVYNTCHTQTVQKINMSLFGKLLDAIKSTQKTQLASTNSDCGSFSSLYISCQTRYGDIDNFVSHENHSCQPAGKCGLGLRQIYFVAWIQICTKPIVFMLLTQELSMEHLWFKW